MSGFLSRMFEDGGSDGSAPHGDLWINPDVAIDGDAGADGNLASNSSTSDIDNGASESHASDQSLVGDVTADANFTITVSLESGGEWSDGDASGGWAHVDQVTLTGDTDALLGGALSHGADDYSADA